MRTEPLDAAPNYPGWAVTPLVEYKLSCLDPDRRTPALTLYVASARALTCFGGVCYALVH